MVFALVAVPVTAHAPQNSNTLRPMDNYVDGSHYVRFVQRQSKEIVYSPQQEEWQAYLKSITTPEEYKTLFCVAKNESGWKMTWNYMNKSGDLNSKWSAYGVFQIIASTARATDPTLDRFDPLENIQLAVKLYRKSGISPWLVAPLCSK